MAASNTSSCAPACASDCLSFARFVHELRPVVGPHLQPGTWLASLRSDKHRLALRRTCKEQTKVTFLHVTLGHAPLALGLARTQSTAHSPPRTQSLGGPADCLWPADTRRHVLAARNWPATRPQLATGLLGRPLQAPLPPTGHCSLATAGCSRDRRRPIWGLQRAGGQTIRRQV